MLFGTSSWPRQFGETVGARRRLLPLLVEPLYLALDEPWREVAGAPRVEAPPCCSASRAERGPDDRARAAADAAAEWVSWMEWHRAPRADRGRDGVRLDVLDLVS